MIIKAPAKINLTLDVLGKRKDGYHDLRMIMQSIGIYDVLTFEKRETPGISLKMNKPLPDGCSTENNLVYKAAILIKERHLSGDTGLNIYLEKNIPAAAGLAGGSTDCAATLIAMNDLYGIGLNIETLCRYGAELGADVPFCIKKGTMLSEGIGEILTPLPYLPTTHVLLIKPDVSVSTGYVYGHLDLDKLSVTPSLHPNTDSIIKHIKQKDVPGVAGELKNVLETVTIHAYPEISEIKQFLSANHALGALMSGSGPTTYGLYQDEIHANMAYKKALDKYPDYDIILTKTVSE